MKRILIIMALAAAVLVFLHSANAQENIKADRLVDGVNSRVSYDIKTIEGEDLILTADYTSARPNPDIANMDIAPRVSISDGSKAFKILTKEGLPIEILFSYSGGDRTGMKISAAPSRDSSGEEYPQILSVESKGGHIINFTFIRQGGNLQEVRIEPLINPFS